MKRIETIRGARTIVETCAGVKAGENVLIITDTNMVEIAEVLAMAVKERDAEPILAVIPDEDKVGQIQKLTQMIQDEIGC